MLHDPSDRIVPSSVNMSLIFILRSSSITLSEFWSNWRLDRAEIRIVAE
jgi:hypothetical protein